MQHKHKRPAEADLSVVTHTRDQTCALNLHAQPVCNYSDSGSNLCTNPAHASCQQSLALRIEPVHETCTCKLPQSFTASNQPRAAAAVTHVQHQIRYTLLQQELGIVVGAVELVLCGVLIALHKGPLNALDSELDDDVDKGDDELNEQQNHKALAHVLIPSR
eukprot:1140961-Pelagomonas_calceolata.AAC.3